MLTFECSPVDSLGRVRACSELLSSKDHAGYRTFW